MLLIVLCYKSSTTKYNFTAKMDKIKRELPFDDDNFLREWTEPNDDKKDLNIKYEANTVAQESDIELEKESEGTDEEMNEPEDVSTKDGAQKSTKDCEIAKNRGYKTKMVPKKRVKQHVLQLDLLLRKLCKSAPVFPNPSSKCVFKCPDCGEDFKQWEALKQHFKTSQCTRKITILNVAEFLTEPACHKCMICSETVLCDPYFLRRHFLIFHSLTITNYTEKFKFFRINAGKERTYSNDIIGNLCVYKCLDCQRRFNFRNSFRHHIRSSLHKKSANYNDHVEKYVYHKCKLCKSTIACEKRSLHSHFKHCHGISQEEYCKVTSCVMAQDDDDDTVLLKSLKVSTSAKNLCTFACGVCKAEFKRWRHLKEHRKLKKHKLGKVTSLSSKACFVKGYSYQCKICLKYLFCDQMLIYNHMNRRHQGSLPEDAESPNKRDTEYEDLFNTFLKDLPISKAQRKMAVPLSQIGIKKTTSTIGNFCTFLCQHCGTSNFTSWRALMWHLEKVHGLGCKYSPSLVVTARYHSCLICPTAVLNDRNLITNHVRKNHKISLTKYESTFKSYGGKTLPSYKGWMKAKLEQRNRSKC